MLPASREVPRILLAKRKTIGLRIPDHAVAQALLQELGSPMMTSSLILPGEDRALTEPELFRDRLENTLDLIIDSGTCSAEPTTVVDLTGEVPEVVRAGKGDPAPFR